jgi:Domain of unknown function (DUF2019)
MNPALSDMTIDQLVERFAAIALEQYEALLDGRYAKYNRLYDQMAHIETELKLLGGDQRRALLPLLVHFNPQVRLKAAIATLAVRPNSARQALQEISDRNEYPQAAEARGILGGLDDGTYAPT